MEINPNKCHFGGIFRSLQRYSHDRKKPLNHDPKCNSTVQQCVHSLTLFFKLQLCLLQTKHCCIQTKALPAWNKTLWHTSQFFQRFSRHALPLSKIASNGATFCFGLEKTNRNELKKYHTFFFVSKSILRKTKKKFKYRTRSLDS